MKIRSILLAWALICISVPAAAGMAFKTYGDIASYAIPALAGALALAKDDGDGLVQLENVYSAAVATTNGIKITVRRVRPDGSDNDSFPSGHTTRAFAGASYIHHRYGLSWAVPAYIAAAMVGASRVDAHKHYWTDVVAGVVVASVMSGLLTDRYESDMP